MKSSAVLATLLMFLFLVTPAATSQTVTTNVITPSCSSSESVSACTSQAGRYSIITYYVNPLGNLRGGVASYMTIVVIDNKTGKITIRKIPERYFENRTFTIKTR